MAAFCQEPKGFSFCVKRLYNNRLRIILVSKFNISGNWNDHTGLVDSSCGVHR